MTLTVTSYLVDESGLDSAVDGYHAPGDAAALLTLGATWRMEHLRRCHLLQAEKPLQYDYDVAGRAAALSSTSFLTRILETSGDTV